MHTLLLHFQDIKHLHITCIIIITPLHRQNSIVCALSVSLEIGMKSGMVLFVMRSQDNDPVAIEGTHWRGCSEGHAKGLPEVVC